MGLVVYDQKKTGLSEIAFLKDTFKQMKIRDIDSYEFTKQLSLIIMQSSLHIGLKSDIPDFFKRDIKEMILMRFKNLSINQIEYAFKMERYGSLGDATEHYQEFNAKYVATILEKYTKWERTKKIEHNISEQKKEVVVSEKEKQYWINRGVTECLDHYEETGAIMNGKLYVYDILYDLDYLPKDLAYKKKIKADAIEVIQFEQKSRKASTVDEKKEISFILEDILKPKSGILVSKCKELVLLEFFRKLFHDAEKVLDLKDRFKVEDIID